MRQEGRPCQPTRHGAGARRRTYSVEMTPPVALSSASLYPQGCADTFEMAARLGYDGVEVMVWSDRASQDVATVAELSAHFDQPVVAVHAPTLLLTQRVWGAAPWPKVERAAAMAAELGAATVVVHPPFRWQREYAAGFPAGVARVAAEHGVTIAVENMYPWRARSRELEAYSPNWDTAHSSPETFPDVTLDVSHAAVSGQDCLELAKGLGGRLKHLHLTDGTGAAKDEHLLPGEGTQPVAELLAHLGSTGFAGAVVLEVGTRRSRSPGEREGQLASALVFTRRHLAAGPPPAHRH